ncbi:SDR family NAD(P)-dependent oxidoreductase [Spirosoma montaniterrae]|uniref:Short-chain dehydrogenase n=1 Tax=Spirosoma montaniterrae TaxID=1178516 RepID=A0A1P9WWB3_9BACT|nr:SDR family NAD(P)-dependent oxidoreductase [Spirosoma montaniterrae]AQG79620.1 short-chain dehydrogenase [Spirosoma montaniterrae]
MSNHLLIVGAGPGVALGVAKRFGRENFRVSLVARRIESLQNLQQQLATDGVDVGNYSADVANFDQLRQTLLTVLAERGPATVLLYNPSVYREADALTLDPELFMQDMRTDVAGLLVAVQAVAPAMQQAGSGTVLVTGGSTALQPYGPLTSLSVGKAAVRNMAECVRQTLEPLGIRVGTVTIMGAVGSNDHFSPDRIADAFWTLYQQPRTQWTFERMYE